jgi:hypothetical protein
MRTEKDRRWLAQQEEQKKQCPLVLDICSSGCVTVCNLSPNLRIIVVRPLQPGDHWKMTIQVHDVSLVPKIQIIPCCFNRCNLELIVLISKYLKLLTQICINRFIMEYIYTTITIQSHKC